MPLTEKQKNGLTSALTKYAAKNAECALYNWSADFSLSELKSYYNDLVKELKKLNIDFNNLTKEDCKLLGCSESNFIPLYLFEVLPNDTKVTSIFNDNLVWGDDSKSNDTRGGFIAYKLQPIENENTKELTEDTEVLTETKLVEVKEWLTQQIKDLTNEDMTYEVYPSSYDDYFSERTVLEKFKYYCENIDFYCSFEGCLVEDSFLDADTPLFDEIKANARKEGPEFESLYNAFCEECGSEYEAFINCGYNGITVKVEDFLNHDYRINLMLATDNERNYDMGAISDYFIDEDRFVYDDPANDKREDNALTYLIKQQGGSDKDVKDAYKNLAKEMEEKNYKEYDSVLEKIDDDFIKSVVDELYNYPDYGMSEVTALVTLRGRDLIEVFDSIAHKEGNIQLSKDTSIGLYEEWNGAGSQFDIQLNKPLVFPATMIRNVQVEKAGRDVNRGWTVGDTYDLIGSCWKGECSAVKDDEIKKDSIKNKQYMERD